MRTKRAKWRRWHERIDDQMKRLAGWHAGWQAVDADPAIGEARRSFVGEVYAHALAMGIRRQLKSGSRDVSLVRLLEDIAAHAGELAVAGDASAAMAALARRDLAELRRAVRPAEAFADRAVAHADRRAGGEPPIEVLHAALDRLVSVHGIWGGRLGS